MDIIVVGKWLVFFFQAEDGIRDTSVTGVQTCALPIFLSKSLNLRSRAVSKVAMPIHSIASRK